MLHAVQMDELGSTATGPDRLRVIDRDRRDLRVAGGVSRTLRSHALAALPWFAKREVDTIVWTLSAECLNGFAFAPGFPFLGLRLPPGRPAST
jgi:hypothetical protein